MPKFPTTMSVARTEKTINTRLPVSFVKNAFINYICAAPLLMFGFIFYAILPYTSEFFSGRHDLLCVSVTVRETFAYLFIIYSVLLFPYYLTLPSTFEPKSRLVWKAILKFGKRPISHAEKIAVLACLVKFFYLPMMLAYFLQNGEWVLYNAYVLFIQGYSFFNIYWLLMSIMILVDVFLYTLGYAIEHPKLKNEIVSVDRTFLGWAVCLACYPPFINLTYFVLRWSSSNYPEFDNVWLQVILGSFIIILMIIYAWSAAALNLKASNLTNRGIVTKGPFRWVRHPAYASKNLAWYIGAIAILLSRWDAGFIEFCIGIISITGWSYIYYLRAITEERHLSADPQYRKYCCQVTKRFIPGIF